MPLPGFIESTLKEQLSLPIKKQVESAITSGTQTLVQSMSNFGSASSVLKQSEAVSKIAGSGLASKFTSLTNGLGFQNSNGSINLVNTVTRQPLATVGSTRDQSLPASLIMDDNANNTGNFRVVLYQTPDLTSKDGQDSYSQVVFDVMPTIEEGRTASYDAVPIIHHPGDILKYKSTSSRSWSISATLASRTAEEAAHNRKIINTIRSWVMPFHGLGTEKSAGAQYLGAPPPILTLKAYGDRMIGPVKCVLEQYSWQWPNEVDYIPTKDFLEPFPVIIQISLNLKESFSPAEYSGFDLIAYRKANMSSAFVAVKSGKRQQQPNTNAQVAASPSAVSTAEPKNLTASQAASNQSTRPPAAVSKPSLPKPPGIAAVGNISNIDIGANSISDLGGMP